VPIVNELAYHGVVSEPYITELVDHEEEQDLQLSPSAWHGAGGRMLAETHVPGHPTQADLLVSPSLRLRRLGSRRAEGAS